MKYNFLPQLIARTTTVSYEESTVPKRSGIRFWVALYLANPILHKQLAQKGFKYEDFSAREKTTVLNYYNRYKFRPTPFGFFSCVSLLKWGSQDEMRYDYNNLQAILMLDQGNLTRIEKFITSGDITNSTVTLNPTLYKNNNEYRYIRSSISHGSASYIFTLECVPSNRLLVFVENELTSGSLKITQLASSISGYMSTSISEALSYISFLLQSTVLISDQMLNITGVDYLQRMAKILPDFPKVPGAESNASMQGKSGDLTANFKELSELESDLEQWLTKLPEPAPRSNFYSGLISKAPLGTINTTLQPNLIEAVTVAALMHQPSRNTELQDFKQRFLKRYEQQKVPLLEVLDPYIGLGYGSYDGALETPFVEDVDFGTPGSSVGSINWTDTHRMLLKKWSPEGSLTNIELDDDDLRRLAEKNLVPPEVMTIMFRLVANDQIQIDSIGPGFGALVGRFTSWSKEMLGLGKQLAGLEQSEDVIHAEILQLSNSHVDNINQRGQVYDYEIPINAVSLRPHRYQIKLSELLLSVVNGDIVLECAVRRRRIIPRLTSAYNYRNNPLAIFRFLCDLQFQDRDIISAPDLSSLFPGLSYYPRLTYKNIIFSPATWVLKDFEIINMVESLKSDDKWIFATWKRKKGLPDYIAFAKNDQQLVFALNKKSDRSLFAEAVNGETNLVISEYFLPSKKKAVINNAGKPHVSQLVSFLYRETQTRYLDNNETKKRTSSQKKFALGSKWLYLKLYCNPAASNYILTKKIAPALEELKKHTNLQWFFIRYDEAGYHIRLRLKLQPSKVGQALHILHGKLGKNLLQIIKEYQADTYKPEWERYGIVMKSVESCFNKSSDLVLGLLSRLPYGENDPGVYYFGFFTVNVMLVKFLPDLEHQLLFITMISNSLSSEYNSPTLKISMDTKYRNLKLEIKNVLGPKSEIAMQLNRDPDFLNFKRTIVRVAKQTDRNRDIHQRLLADLIHMHLNRLFTSRQRESELLTYYCLLKFKLSQKALSKYPKTF